MNTLQLSLFPARRTWWPQCLRRWMREANAAEYYNKYRFYSLKDRLMRRYGFFLGYNIQKIEQICHRCKGTGDHLWWHGNKYDCCWDCNGTGVYRTDYHVLERYRLFGDTYHRPILLSQIQRYGSVGRMIHGKIHHGGATPGCGFYAHLKLCFIFHQREFWDLLWPFLQKAFRIWSDDLFESIAEAYKLKVKYGYDINDNLPF
jgi:hypothetical protein